MNFILIIVALLFVLLILNRKSILIYLINQCKKPKGIIGIVFIHLWNKNYSGLAKWGIESFNNKESSVVLDIGYGGGKSIQLHSRRSGVKKIYGIDISNSSKIIASNLNKSLIEDGKVKLEVQDVHQLSFENEMFDLVSAFQTHFYWESLEAALSEIYRVTKNNGMLILASEKDKIKYHSKKYSNNHSIQKLFERIGYRDLKIEEKGKWIKYIVHK